MRALVLLCALAYACTCSAQSPEVQRALIQRDQQSDEFSQQLRQSQENVRAAPGNAGQKQKTETRQLEERERLENLDTRQRQQAVQPGTPKTLRPYEREKAAGERRELVQPPPAGAP